MAQSQAPLAVDEAATRLTFTGDHFQFALPIVHGPPGVIAQVTAELVNPTGVIRSTAKSACRLESDRTACRFDMPPALPDPRWPSTADEDDLPLLRVRYTIAVAGAAPVSGILALDRIAPELFELHVAAPDRIRRGATYTARVRALHPLTHAPRANVALDATLTADDEESGKSDEVFARQHVVTDADGFASITFTAPPAEDVSSIDLAVRSTLANLHLGTVQIIQIVNNESIELTTDKPLYQPGQTVHVRLLLLDRNGHANAGKNIRVDVTDPDSTLVFRASAVTSRFGIATIDWQVPVRMRLGEYQFKAELPDEPDNRQQAIATVRLSRYDLPTFVVAPQPDRTFYLPGSNAIVDVRANYLFGKPILHGHVRVVREDDRSWNFAEQRFDVKQGKAVSGELESSGVFHAHIDLSGDLKQFSNQEPSNRFEDLHLVAYVTDASTGRTEQRRFDLRVTSQGLHLYVTSLPQTAGLPGHLYLAATTADGTPAECDITLALLPRKGDDENLKHLVARQVVLKHLHTDARGLARIDLPTYEELLKLQPSSDQDEPLLYVAAKDHVGHSGATTEPVRQPSELVRVTTNTSIYRPGDAIAVTLESAQPALPLTVQLLRGTSRGVVLLETRETALVKGKATLSFATDQRFSGIISVNVLALGVPAQSHGFSYGEDMGTSMAARAIFFPRDNALHVNVRMSAETYKPGEEASASLTVRGPQDPDGDDTALAPSALGIVAVDQAVEERNRSDSDFAGGNSPFFFFGAHYWEESSAGGFTPDSLTQLDLSKPLPAGADLAAEILLTSYSVPFATTNNTASDNLAGVFSQLLNTQLNPARLALLDYLRTHTELPTTEAELVALLSAYNIDLLALRDPWGMPFTLVYTPQSGGESVLLLHSDGPDNQHGNADDFDVQLASWHWFNGHLYSLQHAVDTYHRRTGAYIRSLSALRDEMQQEHIDFAAWRDPWGQSFTYIFPVQQTSFHVEVFSAGDPKDRSSANDLKPSYFAGSAPIDYTLELKQRIEIALNTYAATHPYPRTDAELRAALRTVRISPALLVDPWRHPLYITFRNNSFFTDRIRTEAHATSTASPEVRTIVTPVTATSDLIDLRSMGPDGKHGTLDDFTYATFSFMRSLQGAKESVATHPSHQSVHAGPGGDIAGTVTDPMGAVIPGALATATNIKTGDAYEDKTDSQGRFLIGPIPAGSYKVKFSLPGFMDLVYDQVIVLANNTVTLDAKLNVGSANETVEVQAAPAMLSTESASIATTTQVANLPLMPRGLLALQPGVVGSEPTATPRLRTYFPETLLWRPEIVTASDGTATLHFPAADNITTWKLSAAASTLEGNTGFGIAQFRTFQPFFAAFDPPSVLTVGDSIALPVTLRNYLDHALNVTTSITLAPWFRIDGGGSYNVAVPSQQSVSPIFHFTALAPAHEAQQQFIANAGETGDRIARPVTVHPNGLESAVTAAAILSPGTNTLSLTLPADTLPNSTDTTLKLYPNFGAHLRDALVAMAAYPGGCAEQILSIAWPSLLLQRYTANLPQKDDKLAQQTHRYLEQAYENLLANQLASGGFAYWQHDRYADAALTAYAVQFLNEARDYIAIDDKVLANAVRYLAQEQQSDGRWLRVDRDHKPHPEDTHANAMLTASIAAMIAGAPASEPLLRKALAATQSFTQEFDEPYTLANYTLAALALKDTARSGPALERLRSLVLTENGGAYWQLETNTPFFGWGRAGRVESTAQVLRALLAAGTTPHDDLIARGVLFLDHEQDRYSLWYSTQATARALDVLAAIALQTPAPAPESAPAALAIEIDGHSMPSVALPPATLDAGPIFVPLGSAIAAGTHAITLTLPQSASSATAQLVANLYRPWPTAAPQFSTINNEQLRISINFSTTTPTPRKPVDVTARIERIGFRGYGMLIAEIGLPPGANVDRASLESAVNASGYQLNHYEVLPDKVLVYLWPHAGGLTLHFKFTPRYRVDALTAPSAVYDYYNPDARFDLSPARFKTR